MKTFEVYGRCTNIIASMYAVSVGGYLALMCLLSTRVQVASGVLDPQLCFQRQPW